MQFTVPSDRIRSKGGFSVLNWLYNRNNITFIIAVASFIMSIYNFIIAILQNQTHIKADFPHCFRFENTERCVDVLHVKILNLSKTPIVLSRVSVSNGSASYSFGTYRKELFRSERRESGKLVYRHVWISDELPLKIEGNGCANLLLVSDGDVRTFKTDSVNRVLLHTGKKTIRYKLAIDDFSDKELLEQCREPN